jgi:hypothetical protein
MVRGTHIGGVLELGQCHPTDTIVGNQVASKMNLCNFLAEGFNIW